MMSTTKFPTTVISGMAGARVREVCCALEVRMPSEGEWTVRAAVPDDLPRLAEMLLAQTPWAELGFTAERCRSAVGESLDELRVAERGDGTPVGFLQWRATY